MGISITKTEPDVQSLALLPGSPGDLCSRFQSISLALPNDSDKPETIEKKRFQGDFGGQRMAGLARGHQMQSAPLAPGVKQSAASTRDVGVQRYPQPTEKPRFRRQRWQKTKNAPPTQFREVDHKLHKKVTQWRKRHQGHEPPTNRQQPNKPKKARQRNRRRRAKKPTPSGDKGNTENSYTKTTNGEQSKTFNFYFY